MWTEITPKNLDELCAQLHQQASTSWTFIYRGQSDASWELKPSLLRELETYHVDATEEQLALVEGSAIEYFRTKSPMLLGTAELDLLDYVAGALVLMQHYGAPTRLLDWSRSPWVAAYFAAIDQPAKDGLIWGFNEETLDAISPASTMCSPSLVYRNSHQPVALADLRDTKQWADLTVKLPKNQICMIAPWRENQRMAAQQARFTMASNILTKHDIIAELLSDPNDTVRIRISATLKHELIRNLIRMNIGARTLFPDITGLANYTREAVRHQPLRSLQGELSNRAMNLSPLPGPITAAEKQ